MMFFDVHSRQLSEVHEWVGIIFVIALLLHLARNWRGMLAMMSSTRSKAIVGGLGAVALLFIIGSVPFGYGVGMAAGMAMDTNSMQRSKSCIGWRAPPSQNWRPHSASAAGKQSRACREAASQWKARTNPSPISPTSKIRNCRNF